MQRRPSRKADDPRGLGRFLELASGPVAGGRKAAGELGRLPLALELRPLGLEEELTRANQNLLLAGYDGRRPLVDPMCGSGTFAVEAALIATATPPGLRRAYAFERWRLHDRRLFEEVQHGASRGDLEALIRQIDRWQDDEPSRTPGVEAIWLRR